MIREALEHAATEHVVYFLLTSYVEARVHGRRLDVPDDVKRFPIRDEGSVNERSRRLRELLENGANGTRDARMIEEAFAVFHAAGTRLAALRGSTASSARGCRKRAFKRPPPADRSARARVYGPGRTR